MKEFRPLTSEEINVLESHGCWAEDWSSVMVAEGFSPKYLSRVLFYGENRLGAFEETLEVTKGFFKHSGIINATLRNVTVGPPSFCVNLLTVTAPAVSARNSNSSRYSLVFSSFWSCVMRPTSMAVSAFASDMTNSFIRYINMVIAKLQQSDKTTK